MTLTQRVYWFGRIKEMFPHICPTLLTFFNHKTGQKLKYYISTNILVNMCWDLENDIANSDGLIISGYHPDKKLLEYIGNPINLYCYSGTCYKLDDDEVDDYDNLIYWSFNNLKLVNKYFNQIYMVNKHQGNIVQCENISLMNDLVCAIRITIEKNENL